MEFYRKSIEAVARELSTDLDGGLSLETARDRLKEYGPNVIPLVKGDSAIVIFLKQLFNPLMGVLMIGMVTSFVIAYYKEAFVIGLALLLTAIIGFIQEWKAARDIALLKSYEIDYAKVRRDGIIYSIPISEVVPGDILLLEQGMKVAADVRLVRVNDLCTQEALLTGESQPITKDTAVITEAAVVGDQKNMAYAGTFIAGGEGEGVVVATGRKTYLGSLSHLLGATERPRTPLQHQMERLSWWLGILFCLVTSVVMAIGYAHGISVLDLVITGIALAVAAIPESLPVAVTVILAIGVRRMVKRKALVRHLVAAETLGNVSVICADKTGTLTQGKMQVVRLASLDQSIALEQQKSPALTDATRLLLAAAVLNTDVAIDPDSGDVVGSPTEVSLVECARHVAVDSAAFGIGTQHKEEIPFSSDKKLKATLHDAAQSTYTLIVKGAPENVFALCEQDAFCASLRDQVNRFTMDGLRLLAVAIKRDVTTPIEKELHNMQCLGIIGFYDPLRETAAKTIEQLENAGITLVMVTGDHKETAVSVAKKAGLIAETNAVMTGAELSSISDAQLSHKIEQIAVFSRVDPADKIRIVNAWRAHGKSVAMIGDGVNDAPALKASNIGVAVGSGADVTHDIADMILLDDNLATIERAVYEGRVIFDNIRKVIMYLVAHGFAETAFIGLSIVFGLPLPLLPTQIFWMNLITDALPYVALAVDQGASDIMKRKPLSKHEPIINAVMQKLFFISSFVIVVGLFCQYLLFYRLGTELIRLRSILFSAMVVDILFFSFSARHLYASIFARSLKPNYWLWLANLVGIALQLIVLYVPFLQSLFSTVPLRISEWLLLIVFGCAQLLIIEIVKVFFLTSPSAPATILQDKN